MIKFIQYLFVFLFLETFILTIALVFSFELIPELLKNIHGPIFIEKLTAILTIGLSSVVIVCSIMFLIAFPIFIIWDYFS